MSGISLIAAVANNNVIGMKNKMPWKLPHDLQYFKNKTIGNIVVMGRKTYQSLGRPLPCRVNIVFTSEMSYENVFNIPDFESFFTLIEANSHVWENKEIFIIGGGELYQLFLPYATTIYLTRINANIPGDTYFPKIDINKWKTISREKGKKDNNYDYEFLVLKKKIL